MTHGIYFKWIIIGIGLLIIFSATFYVWDQLTKAQYKEEAAKTAEFVRQWKINQKPNTKTARAQTTSSKPLMDSKMSTAEKTTTQEHAENDNTTAEQQMPKMSPFGLGPYPEIPKDWDTPYLWKGCDSIKDELLARVIVKMHNEGIYSKYSSVGINHGTGLITAIEHNSVLVEYETDKNGEQVIWSVKGHPSVVPRGASSIWKRASDIPSYLKVVTPDEISFDPYEFLGIQ